MSDSPDASEDRCFICGDDHPNRLQTHHVVPRRFGGSNQPENLVRLCASCHQAIEKLYDDTFYERLGVRANGEEAQVFPSEGTVVDEREARDRELPEGCPHVVFEREPVEDPPDSENEQEDGVWQVTDKGRAFKGDIRRIHCGYCPTVFEPYEHAKAARHLRVHHFIDPFEKMDSDWSGSLVSE